jgi:hypothetical protein
MLSTGLARGDHSLPGKVDHVVSGPDLFERRETGCVHNGHTLISMRRHLYDGPKILPQIHYLLADSCRYGTIYANKATTPSNPPAACRPPTIRWLDAPLSPDALATAGAELVADPEGDARVPVTVAMPEVNTAGTESVVVGAGRGSPRLTAVEEAP